MSNSKSIVIDADNSLAAARPVTGARLHGLDFTRGMACLSMPIFHTVYNLHQFGFTDANLTKATFWLVYQKLGLGTFVLVSGMAFILSTQRGVRWDRLLHRALKLGLIAMGITLATYIAMPDRFVRFGVLHFFTTTILLAPLLRPLRHWLILPGLAIIGVAFYVGRTGAWPEPALYITGLMSQRPSSIDYIPLIPWLGVFMLGMGLAQWLPKPKVAKPAAPWMRPVIWLGKHSLWFYLLHQAVLYGLFYLAAMLLG